MKSLIKETSYMKKIKYSLLLAACVLAVAGALICTFTYGTECRAVLLDTVLSPDGKYRLDLFSVGEPYRPFGSAHGLITLTKDRQKISETEIDLAKDGCQISKENWTVIWQEDCAKVTLYAFEQEDEHLQIFFDGRVEQLADSSIDSIPPVQMEKPAMLTMTVSERENGEAVFTVSVDDFFKSFNYIYEERNGHSFLNPLDTQKRFDGKTPFYEYPSSYYHFSSDPKQLSIPMISIFVPETGEGIYEFKLTFDDHGYREAMYQEYVEVCFCALSTILPELSENEIITLYYDLYEQTAKNFWGNYYSDSAEERPVIEVMYRSENIGFYGYYGAGTANICIVPLNENAIEALSIQEINFQSAR